MEKTSLCWLHGFLPKPCTVGDCSPTPSPQTEVRSTTHRGADLLLCVTSYFVSVLKLCFSWCSTVKSYVWIQPVPLCAMWVWVQSHATHPAFVSSGPLLYSIPFSPFLHLDWKLWFCLIPCVTLFFVCHLVAVLWEDVSYSSQTLSYVHML